MKLTLLTAALFFFLLELNAKIVYVEPVRNAEYVSINNNIIIGFDERIESKDLNSVLIVKGSISGIHTGEMILTADKKRLIFKPHQPYAFNEEIEVTLNGLKTSLTSKNQLTYTFKTRAPKSAWDPSKAAPKEYGYPEYNNFSYNGDYSILPQLTVTISNNPSPGNLFLTNYQTGSYTPHLMIAKNDGTFIFEREENNIVADFSRQPNGTMTYFTNATGKYYAEDNLNNVVDSFYCGNGYSTDGHELRVLNNGHALVMSYDSQTVDMSQIVPGGNPNAIVIGLIIQEIDVNKDVIFQWRSWDHILITDAVNVNLLAASVDYIHGNAIELDNDGHLMISSRHLNEITKISRTTGETIWRLGGVNNQFTFINEPLEFHYQHYIRRLPNGNIILYDNGNFRPPLFSRAVEYHLDEVNKVATLVWQYKNNPDIYGPFMGSAQRLRNGNTLIGWGGTNPTITEVTPAGTIALQMSLPAGVWSYRVFRDEVTITLNMKLAIEGFYNSQTNTLNLKDTVRVYLRNINSPYSIVDSAKSVVDSVNFNGNFRFYNTTGGNYYISTKHRNGLETWSKTGGESFISGGVYLYDLTNSAAQAYGSNLVLKGLKYCIYSGDVNQDGDINLTDVLSIYNDATGFISGYVNTDVNGDKETDLTDQLITYNNAVNFVAKVNP